MRADTLEVSGDCSCVRASCGRLGHGEDGCARVASLEAGSASARLLSAASVSAARLELAPDACGAAAYLMRGPLEFAAGVHLRLFRDARVSTTRMSTLTLQRVESGAGVLVRAGEAHWGYWQRLRPR
jgi:hypothetical protein